VTVQHEVERALGEGQRILLREGSPHHLCAMRGEALRRQRHVRAIVLGGHHAGRPVLAERQQALAAAGAHVERRGRPAQERRGAFRIRPGRSLLDHAAAQVGKVPAGKGDLLLTPPGLGERLAVHGASGCGARWYRYRHRRIPPTPSDRSAAQNPAYNPHSR